MYESPPHWAPRLMYALPSCFRISFILLITFSPSQRLCISLSLLLTQSHLLKFHLRRWAIHNIFRFSLNEQRLYPLSKRATFASLMSFPVGIVALDAYGLSSRQPNMEENRIASMRGANAGRERKLKFVQIYFKTHVWSSASAIIIQPKNCFNNLASSLSRNGHHLLTI